jgi:hypothetical protein
MKRLVDLVDRGPEDDLFFPVSSNNTIFRREWRPYHNVVPEIVEVGYKGNATWGQRITVELKREETGDLIQWLCLRLKPRTWLPADLEEKLRCGAWSYADPSGAWMWAASLGSIAIERVEFEVGDAVVETWGGEWMDVWSRTWLDAGRAAVWDSDIYGQLPPWELHDVGRPAWTTLQPTEDGYIYCWLPLAFFRRPQTAFPLISVGPQQEVRVHITLRRFADVVRKRAIPRMTPDETPLGQDITLVDNTGLTPIPWTYTLGSQVPGFEDTTVFAGVVHTEDPLRSAYMRVPVEMMYERVMHAVYTLPDAVMAEREGCGSIHMNIPLREINGPIREICWFVRRKAVWGYNEWTNYGALLEDELVASIDPDSPADQPIAIQEPLVRRAKLMVGNAVWRDESEQWWREEYGLAHRGGVRLSNGMVYGFVLGDAQGLMGEEFQPSGTVNSSRADLRLDLEIQPPVAAAAGCDSNGSEWTVHVFAIGLNWLRFVRGIVAPVFAD